MRGAFAATCLDSASPQHQLLVRVKHGHTGSGGVQNLAQWEDACAFMQAVQAVCRGDIGRAFAVVRPPGHHAECARAMGFCFYNNVAVAALAARQQRGIERVLVLDWDVHHGKL